MFKAQGGGPAPPIGACLGRGDIVVVVLCRTSVSENLFCRRPWPLRRHRVANCMRARAASRTAAENVAAAWRENRAFVQRESPVFLDNYCGIDKDFLGELHRSLCLDFSCAPSLGLT